MPPAKGHYPDFGTKGNAPPAHILPLTNDTVPPRRGGRAPKGRRGSHAHGNRRCSILAAQSRTIAYVSDLSCDCAAGMPHLLYWQNATFGYALTICSFSPSEIRVFGRRAGTARKKRSHTRLAEIRMSRNPLQTCPFDGTRGTPGAETRPAGKPAGGFRRQNDTGNVFGKKFQRERKTAPKPPRKGFCTGIFSSEPRNKNSEPRKKNSGARNFAFRPRNFSSDPPKSKLL